MSSSPTKLGRSATMRAPRVSTHEGDQGNFKDTKPRRRTYSSSSVTSAVSSSKSELEDQFVFSPHQTPAHERSSFFPPTHSQGPPSLAPSAACSAQPSVESSLQTSRKLSTHTKTAFKDVPTPHSRPIAIELPPSASRQNAAKSVYTPIEPVSGRGDLPGGYFPFHENPEKRITRPHPFHTDSQDAQVSANIYVQQSPSAHQSPATAYCFTVPGAASNSQAQQPMMSSAAMSSSRGTTPVTAYTPSGHHDMPMPLGKYYPSNYEAARSRQGSRQNSTHISRAGLRPPSSGHPSSTRSDSAVPQANRTESSRNRADSDIQKKVKQYQRDMVAQATYAALRLSSSKDATSLAAAHGVSMQSFQAGSNKPTSPRLQPLGSPGPVTPMELEISGDGGYLTRGRSVPSPDSRRDSEAVARALRADEERKRREGRGSPTVQAGGFGF